MAPSVSTILTTFNQPHTLRLVLLALARQSQLPDEVIIADDGSAPPTLDALRRLAPDLPFPLIHVFQPDQGFRAARSRNNAIHHSRSDLLTFLDQDTLPRADWLATYARHTASGRFGIGRILDLPPDAAQSLTPPQIADGTFESLCSTRQYRDLIRRHRKFCIYALLRRAGVGIKTKPKLRSCNFAAFRVDLLQVNGFDEEFHGWGQEDDDLGRRLFAVGVHPTVLLRHAVAFHIPHPPRRTTDWEHGRNITLLTDRSRAAYCRQGLDQHPHPDVVVTAL